MKRKKKKEEKVHTHPRGREERHLTPPVSAAPISFQASATG